METDILFPVFVRQGRSRRKYKAGYMNRDGEIVVEPIYDAAHPFSDGLAAVKVGEKWGAINNHGELVIEPFSGMYLAFAEDRSQFSLAKGGVERRGIVDRTGKIIVPAIYKHVSWYSSGLALIHHGDQYGFIDRHGNMVIPPFFEDARPFSEGLAAAKLNGKWGYINSSGALAVEYRFDSESAMAGPFRQGLARVPISGRWGYINPLGDIVIPGQFDMGYEFSEGLARNPHEQEVRLRCDERANCYRASVLCRRKVLRRVCGCANQ